MKQTLIKKNLEYRGPYQLRILKKTMSSPGYDYQEVPIFIVETDDQKYKGRLEVNLMEYKKGKVGQYFGMGGLILYTKKPNCYYMSKYDNPKLAIRKAVNWARIRFILVAIVMLLFALTVVEFIIPLFEYKFN